ncbi:permease prefix domain 1-containing protein [Cellulomonas persica]|uniref:Uncharacterized protein n=1 Tax=Cellulomonas persica TaxID=76861 RepID=A0A510UXD4_9CELL|nr:permease prefix domain 1-containing protein [Cellulomonas persica]GEK19229.1 hypothetical protein CPE01_29620 [Cellulomonas persica]
MNRPIDREHATGTATTPARVPAGASTAAATRAADLTARYVDAAMRTVPEAQRADLAAELRASIDDQVEARIADGEDPHSAERAVLTGLGDPDRLAAGYTDRPLYLIGPRLFLDWWRLLKLLLAIVVPAVMGAVALGGALDEDPFGAIIGSVVVTGLGVAVHLAFWTTLVFAIVERSAGKDAAPFAPWSVDKLPEQQDSGRSVAELVTSLVLLAVAAGAVIWDHARGLVVTSQTDESFLDPSLWPTWTTGLFVLLAAEALLAVTVYARRRWTTPLAAVNALLDVGLAAGVMWLYSQDRLVNPEFFASLVDEDAAEVTSIVSTVLLFVIVGSAVWDAIDAFRKARRAGPA